MRKKRKISKMDKIFLVRKLVICTIALIVVGKAIWELFEWGFAIKRDNQGIIWFFVLFLAISIFAYFWEQSSTKYKEKKKRRS